jgi:hypothetical protein
MERERVHQQKIKDLLEKKKRGKVTFPKNT